MNACSSFIELKLKPNVGFTLINNYNQDTLYVTYPNNPLSLYSIRMCGSQFINV